MKKLLLLFLFIVLKNTSYSQEFSPTEVLSYLNQVQQQKFYIDSSVLQHADFLKGTQLKNDCIDEYDSVSLADNEQLFLIDFNNDNSLELVFSGWCSPYFNTQVYSLKDGVWNKLFETGGILLNLSAKEFIVYTESCCCLEYNSVAKYTINAKNQVSLTDQIIWSNNTELPNNINSSSEFNRKKLTDVIFRTYEIVLDEPTDEECTDAIKTGNQLLKASTNNWTILEEKTIDLLPWKLILFKPFDLKNVHAQNNFTAKVWYVGWTVLK